MAPQVDEQVLSDLELVLTRDLAPHLKKLCGFGPGHHDFKSEETDGLSCRVEYTRPVADLPDQLRLNIDLSLPKNEAGYSAQQIARTLIVLGDWAKRELGTNRCPRVGHFIAIGYYIVWEFQGVEAAEVLSHLQRLNEVAA